MNICKESEVKAIGRADETELAQINRLTRRELMADEVYTFAVRLCDNDIDRDGERFADETLKELGQLFVGVSGVFDHQWTAKGQNARIYRTEVVEEPALATADGRPYAWLKGWAYMVRTQENEGLIAEIDGGIKREVSVGCAVEQVLCSVCGEELARCPHEKGEEYNGRECHGVLTHATDAYEWSFVAVPAQRKAGVVKSAKRLEDEARLGRRYLKSLRTELVRLAGLAEPEAEYELLKRVADKLDEEELLGLTRLCQGKVDQLLGPVSQLSYGEDAAFPDRADGAFLI